jgi:cell division septal protein FtsQ
MKRTILVFGLLVYTIAVFSQEKAAIASLPKVEINGSHQLKIHSAIVDQEYLCCRYFCPAVTARAPNNTR